MGLVGFISWIVFEGNFFLADKDLFLVIAAGRKGEQRSLAAAISALLQKYSCTTLWDRNDTFTLHFFIPQDWRKLTACTA